MLTAAIWVLGLATLGGVSLLALAQRSRPAGRVWLAGAAHGMLGLAGFAFLLAGLGGPARGTQTGTAGFGVIAAVLIGAGLALGLVLFAARLRRRSGAALLIGLHATLGVAGLVMLAAYLSA